MAEQHLPQNLLVTSLSLQLKFQALLLEMPFKMGPPLLLKRLSHFAITAVVTIATTTLLCHNQFYY